MKKLSLSELNRKTVEEFTACNKIPVSVVLDNIRSQHNIGAVFRTSDAFLIDKIYLCGITATPPQNEIHKSALGAEETVAWEYHAGTVTAIESLRKQGYTIVAIEQAEESIMLENFQFDTNKKYALVFGNEVKGVSQSVMDACDCCIEIPQEGTKHSLNISVSAGIVIWEFFRNLHLK